MFHHAVDLVFEAGNQEVQKESCYHLLRVSVDAWVFASQVGSPSSVWTLDEPANTSAVETTVVATALMAKNLMLV